MRWDALLLLCGSALLYLMIVVSVFGSIWVGLPVWAVSGYIGYWLANRF